MSESEEKTKRAWVKTIECQGESVLFYIDVELPKPGKPKSYCLHQIIWCPDDNGTADFIIGGISEEDIDTVFNSLTEENAVDVLNAMDSMYDQITEEDSYD
jgi:hypothetical protein